MTKPVDSLILEDMAEDAPIDGGGSINLRRWTGAFSILAGLLLWEACARYVNSPLFLAAPSQTVYALYQLAIDGELAHDIYVSFSEFIIGYAVASLFGIVLGLVMASSDVGKRILQPWVSGLYATPMIALGPLFILWFGIGILSKIVVVMILVIFPVIINTEAGIRTTSPRLVEMLRSFGATRQQIFFKVSLPSAAPFILAGLKIAIGRGLIAVVVAELFGSRAGLGRLIAASAESFNMPYLFAAVVVLAGSGIALTAAFSALEKRLVPWSKE